MKKFIAVVTMVMGMSMLAGCGAGADDVAATTEFVSEPTETEAVTEVETETVTEEETEAVTEEETDVATDEEAEVADNSGEWEYGEYTYTGDDMILYAVNFYLCDELAKGYTSGDVGIPCITIIDIDDSDENDIKVWGSFWYWRYSLDGDTLITECGGASPGCMHVAKTDAGAGYTVTSFDPVLDGADYDSSAKEIFGDKYDAFVAVESDDVAREEQRKATIAEYVTSHNVPATKYQDYGWDPVDIPLD